MYKNRILISNMVDLKNIPLKMKFDYAAYADKHEIFSMFSVMVSEDKLTSERTSAAFVRHGI